jgi:hypothetical protein
LARLKSSALTVERGGRSIARDTRHNKVSAGDLLERENIFRIFLQPMTSLPFDRMNRVSVSDVRLIDKFVTIYPDHVPQTSMLREFIGGGGFDV